ncbi:MAG TPA: UDP-N-acetylmuramate--L-alanine ligase [Patescibacteria group bacterium]|nr:UDP-N-acetylmuramate--L-alanine ligase [Patescibacteria group bacterium]
MLNTIQKIHFVGIGGAGMSAIAKVMAAQGYQVSGSDISPSDMLNKLQKDGVRIYVGHHRDNLGDDCQAIVVSTAIPETNPEVQAARERSLPVYHRSDVVAYLMESRQGIAVAGAHGKTTTTSMLALVLEKAGVDPTVLIGGELEFLGGNAKLGASSYLVAEADESDGSFVKFSPQMAIVTNIENDHMDYYHTMDNVLKAFRQFLGKLPPTGVAVLCFDNGHIRDIAENLDRRYISYALGRDADYMAKEIHPQGAFTMFDVYQREQRLGTVKLSVPGRHNVSNSLAVIAVGLEMGLEFSKITEGLAVFQGAKRRFQTKGKINGVWVVDDYAHHPTEIATTLEAALQTTPKRLICVFQPHRYSRTSLLRQEFGGAFKAADQLVLTDIYPAGEAPIPGIDGETIKNEVVQQSGQPVTYVQDRNQLARYLADVVEPGDLVITMGAGNIYQAGEQLVEKLEAKTNRK